MGQSVAQLHRDSDTLSDTKRYSQWYKQLTFVVHLFGEVEREGDGETAEEEDGGRDAGHHHALPAALPGGAPGPHTGHSHEQRIFIFEGIKSSISWKLCSDYDNDPFLGPADTTWAVWPCNIKYK